MRIPIGQAGFRRDLGDLRMDALTHLTAPSRQRRSRRCKVWTSERAPVHRVLVNEMPKQTGIMATPEIFDAALRSSASQLGVVVFIVPRQVVIIALSDLPGFAAEDCPLTQRECQAFPQRSDSYR